MTDVSPPHDLTRWAHRHDYAIGNAQAERNTRRVLWITLATMVLEIAAGWWFNSMAVLADGWHMSSHALAIGLAAFAYAAARKYAHDPRFAFGTWKIEILAGYTSALALIGVAGMMLIESVSRLFSPQSIHYPEAMAVAVLGLTVNLVCAFILGHGHAHGPGHAHGDGHAHAHGHTHCSGHGHDHPHSHADHGHAGDLNLKAAYIHVLTDALTSVLAIVALAGGWWKGWDWLDPLMGILGAVLVALWAKNLLAQTGQVLLDREMDHPVVEEIRTVIATLPGATTLTDLHVWRVGSGAYACTLSLLTHDAALTPLAVRAALGIHDEIVHVTVEIHRCDQCPA